jgi:hypothetical protein
MTAMNFSIWVGGVRRELTPWFGEADRPARTGVYQRNFPAGPYSRWDGQQWLQDRANVATAAVQTKPSRYQEAPWRGLVDASEPQQPSGSPSNAVSSPAGTAAEQPS